MLRFILPLLLVFALPTLAEDKPAVPPVAKPAAAIDVPNDPYKVQGVEVDITGEAATKARDKAFLEGSRKAFDLLAARLSAGDKISAKKLGDDGVGQLIRSFEVEKEKASKDHYVATLTFYFRPAATQNLFASRGIEIMEDPYNKPVKTAEGANPAEANATAYKPYLVLPILRVGGRAILWEEQTSWLRAWLNFLSDYPQADLKIVEGSMEDIRTISAPEALAGLRLPLQKLMQRYQAKGIIIPVLLSHDAQPTAEQDLNIQVARFDENGVMQGTYTVPLYAELGRKSIEWLQAGAGAALGIVRDGMQKSVAVAATEPSTGLPPSLAPEAVDPNAAVMLMTLTIPFSYQADWPNAQRALQNLPGLSQFSTLRMTRDKATVRIAFKGTRQQLEKILGESGYQLVEPSTADGTLLLLPNGQTPVAASRPMFQTVYPEQATPPEAAPLQEPDENGSSDDMASPDEEEQ
jgi:hypothetical protein